VWERDVLGRKGMYCVRRECIVMGKWMYNVGKWMYGVGKGMYCV